MKILHVGPLKISGTAAATSSVDKCAGLQSDGPTRSILGLANALAELGESVAILSTRPIVPPVSTYPNINWLEPVPRQYKLPIVPDIAKWMDRIEADFGRPDIVNFHDVYDMFQLALAGEMRRRGWRYVVTPRGGLRPIPQQRARWKKRLANALFFRRYICGADHVVALTENEAADIRAWAPNTSVVVAPNGIDLDLINRYHELKKVFPVLDTNRPIRFGYIGQLDVDIKGLDLILEALNLVKAKGDFPAWELVMVGGYKSRNKGKANYSKAYISKMISTLGLESSATLPGIKTGDDKWECMLGFDVFFLTSRTEGMPVAVLEAMAFARPCLVSTGTNMDQVIRQANAGWTCEPTVESVFNAVQIILATDAQERQAMGARAQQVVHDQYVWAESAKIYQRAVGPANRVSK